VSDVLFLAVEQAIPRDHPAAWLAVPLGLLFFGGSIILLLWSSYGWRKALAIYGTAFFGFGFLIGLFWWFGAPGVPPGLGISHLPGEISADHQPRWHPFEAGSDRGALFPVHENPEAFQDIPAYLGKAHLDEEALERDPLVAETTGSVGAAGELLQSAFLPVDDDGIAQIGVDRRQEFEDDVAAADLPEGARRAPQFFTARAVDEPRLADDPSGVQVVTQTFQAYANFVDADGVPIEAIPVGEPTAWFGFLDPGSRWLPSALWTIVSFVLFLGSLLALDQLEQREKRRAAEVEEAEDLPVPSAQ
jgi:hypothetical protein